MQTLWHKRADKQWFLEEVAFDLDKEIWNYHMEVICQRTDIMMATDKRALLKFP